MKDILVTGSAGFIGSELVIKLLKKDQKIIGLDNHNNYYDPILKEKRLNRFINEDSYTHYKIDLKDKKTIEKVFKNHNIGTVVNLAAQAGVRYSFENPFSYIESNLVGFSNILECSKDAKIDHLIYASSSSVYGSNKKIPFSIEDRVDNPINLYAASKKSNELMAHAYSYIFKLKTTGLRFFSVYGPWGRPDMALWTFTEKISKGEKIQLYNNGNHKRDFTYIDDIIDGVISVIDNSNDSISKLGKEIETQDIYKIYNIGNNQPVTLEKFVTEIEKNLKIDSIKEYLPLQKGDVPDTWADIETFQEDFDYNPKIEIEEGIKRFVQWYIEYSK